MKKYKGAVFFDYDGTLVDEVDHIKTVRAGQGDGYKEPQADVFVLRYLLPLQVGLLLQLVHQSVEPGGSAAHPVKDPADIYDNKGDGEHIADDAYHQCVEGGQPQGGAEGDSAPQLDHRHHGHQQGKQALAPDGGGHPFKEFQLQHLICEVFGIVPYARVK